MQSTNKTDLQIYRIRNKLIHKIEGERGEKPRKTRGHKALRQEKSSSNKQKSQIHWGKSLRETTRKLKTTIPYKRKPERTKREEIEVKTGKPQASY